MRGATLDDKVKAFLSVFQSTRPMRGATLLGNGVTFAEKISIHAPHAGRDRKALKG